MEIMRDITALEELPEAATTGLNGNRNRNRQGRNSIGCQGQGGPTCFITCGATILDITINTNINI